MTTKKSSQPDEAEIAGVKITHASKVYYPDSGTTKLEIARYYEKVVDYILPELSGRPLSMVRSPEGLKGIKFYQKHPSESFPEYIERVKIKEKEGEGVYITIDNLNDIIYLVNLGVLEFHVWGSKVADLEHPDRLVFDLDPDPGAPWEYVVQGALMIRKVLEDLKLKTFVKVSGGKGLHIVIPIKPEHTWEEAKEFAKAVGESIAEFSPGKFTIDLPKVKREGKVFIDYLRNERGATSIASYSTRARPGATVSLPVFWDEVNKNLNPQKYNLRNVSRRLSGLKKDPWQNIYSVKQQLPI